MQYELNLRDYLRIFQKRRWTIILVPILAGLLGYLFAPVPGALSQAHGRVRIAKRVMPSQVLLEAYYYWEEGSALATHAAVITSREVLKETASSLGYLPPGVSDEELISRQDYIGLIGEMSQSFVALPVAGTSIIEVTCTRPRADEAIRWLNALLDTYAERHTYEINREAIESLRYIEGQLERYTIALQDAEEQLTEFKLQNAEAISLRGDEMGITQEALEDAEFANRVVSLQIEILDHAATTGAVPSLDLLTRSSPGDQQVQLSMNELDALQTRRRQLLSYQTLRSPEVKAVEEQIQGVVEILRERLSADRDFLDIERQRLEEKFRSLPRNDVILARLERDVELHERTYSLLREEHQRAGMREAERVQEVTIIERAVTAHGITDTSRVARGIVAALIGLLLGIVFALVLETLDTSIGAIEDIETLLQLPVIGIIPPIDFEDCKEVIKKVSPQVMSHPGIERMTSLVSHYDPRSPVSEAYRSLRTTVEQMREEVGGQVIMVTSSVLEEGKTTTAANLALVYAQMGRKMLLLTADLRRPDMHKIFGLQQDPGLADILTGSSSWRDVVRSLSDILLGELSMDIVMLTPGMDNLHIIPAGTNPLNPAELLSSEATGELFRELREEFDVIIVDTPPVIPVTDAVIVAEHADGIVLVYEVGKVGRDVLKRAVSHLDASTPKVWGIVMNDVKAEADVTLRDADYRYYRYRYEHAPRSKGSRFKRRLDETVNRWFGGRGS